MEYFTRRRAKGDLYYSGAYFERLGGGGDSEADANRFTCEDLVAITMLSVEVPGHGAVDLLTDPDGHWARLLSALPRDARLEDPDNAPLVAEDGPAWQLWERLCDVKKYPNKPDGVGAVVAGKLLARKRPGLIPVYDSRVKSLLERPKADNTFWAALCQALQADEMALYRQLLRLREKSGIGDDIAVVRVFDVIAWMYEGERQSAA